MGNMLDDLINKQQLISNYLVQNFDIRIDQYTAQREIFDKHSNAVVYGEEIEKDILLFFPFGKKIMTTVVNIWIDSIGLKRGTFDWSRTWVGPSNNIGVRGEATRPTYTYRDISDGPIYIQSSYIHTNNWRVDQDAELELIRALAQNIIIELADYMGVSRLLNDCRNIRQLEHIMSRIGFEKVEIPDPEGTIIRWYEGEETYNRRRSDHYDRLRRENSLSLARERITAQRQLIERGYLEREARIRQEEDQSNIRRLDYRQRYEHQRYVEEERQRYEREREQERHEFGRNNNNIRRYGIF